MDKPRDGYGGFALTDEDCLILKQFIEQHNIKKVVEFGPGRSTVMMDEMGVSVTSYEDDPRFAVNIMTKLKQSVTIKWDGQKTEIPMNVDLILIDGPRSGEAREPSYRIAAKSGAKYIACHDFNREFETKWREKYLGGWPCVSGGRYMEIYSRPYGVSGDDEAYCKAHKDNNYCNRVNHFISEGFCQIACKGNWKPFYAPPLDDMRALYRPLITDEERNNQDKVSVIIPYVEHDSQYLQKTIQSVKENAIGPVEIVLMFDKDKEGLRVMMNRGVEKATGKYVVKLDCHCAMSPEWDARMKASCVGDVIVKPMLDTLKESTWEGVGRDMGFISLDAEMRNTFVFKWKNLPNRAKEEESLSMLGCCFMMSKDYYLRQGGCDISCGIWGALGLEWSLKTWLTGGRLLIRTDTVCYHLFRNNQPFVLDAVELNETFGRIGIKWRLGRGVGQTHTLAWLFERFEQYLKPNVRVAPPEERTSAVRE